MTTEQKQEKFRKLLEKSAKASQAYCYAQGISFDALSELIQKIEYRAFGYKMVQLYYVIHEREWIASLRNEVISSLSIETAMEHQFEFAGRDPKTVLEKLYAYSVYKEYLPKPDYHV